MLRPFSAHFQRSNTTNQGTAFTTNLCMTIVKVPSSQTTLSLILSLSDTMTPTPTSVQTSLPHTPKENKNLTKFFSPLVPFLEPPNNWKSFRKTPF